MANKYMKMYLALFVIREMQVKIKMRYYYIPIRKAEIKNSDIHLYVGKVVEKLEPSYTVGVIVKLYIYFEKESGSFLKI